MQLVSCAHGGCSGVLQCSAAMVWKWIWSRGEANKYKFEGVEIEDQAGQETLESSHEAPEVVPGEGLEAGEKHTVAAGLDILEASVEQVKANAGPWMDAADEAVQTPCKKRGPQRGAARHPGKACRGDEAEARAPQEGST